MRVLHIANGYYKSGVYKELFSAMDVLGIERDVFVPINKKEKYPKTDDVKVHVAQNFNDFDRLLFYSKQRKILDSLKNGIDLSKIDIIHAHTVFSGGFAALKIKKEYGIPYVVAVRNTDINYFFKYMIHLRKVGEEVLSNADKVYFISPAYKRQLLDSVVSKKTSGIIKNKCSVIPNGIARIFLNNKEYKTKPLNRIIKIIYAGNVTKNKNLEIIIDAINLLREESYDISLTVVGNVEDDKYRRILSRNAYIEYHEKCPHEQLIYLYRAADIFIMLSHKETFGLVYAEAMSQGLPILYTRNQGFDGFFPDGHVGYSTSDVNVAEVVDNIKKILSNYDALSRNCFDSVGVFDWTKIAKIYESDYQEIIRDEI